MSALRRARPALAAAALCAAPLAGCDPLDIDDDPCCTVQGVVVDVATGRPLEGIYVELEEPRSERPGLIRVTGADGRFEYRRGSYLGNYAFDLEVNNRDEHVQYDSAYGSRTFLIEEERNHDIRAELRPVVP